MAATRPALYGEVGTPYRLLISGSRDADTNMLDYTRRLVDRAHALGWHLVVGDAHGIDEAAIRRALDIGMSLTVYGITPRGRVYTPKSYPYVRVYADYLGRDDVMASVADRGVFVWNGYSRGTKYTHDQMAALGKPVDLIRFGR